MKKYSLAKASILLLVAGSTFFSCKDDITFEAENKILIDTMFHRQDALMKKEIDSLCIERNQAVYQAAFDSILDLRIEQIQSSLSQAKKKGK